ncbi:AMP-binding enzyme [Hyphomicrobium sp.]|uniref:AMP-binding enzyme n=1 Tax=Hyphomicrobium sp. TaxID=82 RepID=UPI003F70207B
MAAISASVATSARTPLQRTRAIHNRIPADSAGILAYARERLAADKCPREIRFVDRLPRTANGKIRRSSLVRF